MSRPTKPLLVLSLVLGLGCVILWIRSHFTYDTIHYEARSGFQTNVYSMQEKAMLLHSNLYWEEPRGPGIYYMGLAAKSKNGYDLANGFDSSNGRHFWNRLGFKLRSKDEPIGPQIHVIFVSAPYWSLVGLFAALPALQFLRLSRRRWLIRKREGAGRCVVCGYDLRASAGCCPECGGNQSQSRASCPV